MVENLEERAFWCGTQSNTLIGEKATVQLRPFLNSCNRVDGIDDYLKICDKADLALVIGSKLNVQPFASLPLCAKKLVIINLSVSDKEALFLTDLLPVAENNDNS